MINLTNTSVLVEFINLKFYTMKCFSSITIDELENIRNFVTSVEEKFDIPNGLNIWERRVFIDDDYVCADYVKNVKLLNKVEEYLKVTKRFPFLNLKYRLN